MDNNPQELPAESGEATSAPAMNEGESSEGTAQEATEPTQKGSSEEESFTKFDLNSVAEEFRPEAEKIYKSMQGDYTKKMQEIGEVKARASAFEDIAPMLRDPEVVKMLEDYEKGKTSKEGQGDNPYEGYSPEDTETLKFVDERIQKAIEPLLSAVQPLSEEATERELGDLRSKFSDFDEKAGDIADLMEANPNMSPEQAYKLTTYDNRFQQGIDAAAKKAEERRDGAVERSSSGAGVVSNKQASSFGEASAQALRDLKM